MFNLKVDPPKWTVKTGSIRSDIANSSVPCSILHESDFGACIPVAAGADVPDLFSLRLTRLDRPTYAEWSGGLNVALTYLSRRILRCVPVATHETARGPAYD
jgi:hypothetical protein